MLRNRINEAILSNLKWPFLQNLMRLMCKLTLAALMAVIGLLGHFLKNNEGKDYNSLGNPRQPLMTFVGHFWLFSLFINVAQTYLQVNLDNL
jgi:hypothetical protein